MHLASHCQERLPVIGITRTCGKNGLYALRVRIKVIYMTTSAGQDYRYATLKQSMHTRPFWTMTVPLQSHRKGKQARSDPNLLPFSAQQLFHY